MIICRTLIEKNDFTKALAAGFLGGWKTGFRQVYGNLGVNHSVRTSPATQFAKSWIITGKPAALNPNFYKKGYTGEYIKGWNQGFKSALKMEASEYTINLKINLKQQIGENRKRIDEN